MTTKLVVPPMPELPVSLHKPGDHLYGNVNRLREWGEQCAAIAQREAALADELANDLRKMRNRFCTCSIHGEGACTACQIVLAALSKHKEARNGKGE